MKELLQTHSLSYAQGLQLALQGHDIEAVLLDQQAPGYLGFAGRIRLVVARDADYDRAMDIIRALQPAPVPNESPSSWRLQRRGLVLLGCGFGILVVGAALAESGPRGLLYGVLGVAAAVMIAGITLIFLGPGRDRGRSP